MENRQKKLMILNRLVLIGGLSVFVCGITLSLAEVLIEECSAQSRQIKSSSWQPAGARSKRLKLMKKKRRRAAAKVYRQLNRTTVGLMAGAGRLWGLHPYMADGSADVYNIDIQVNINRNWFIPLVYTNWSTAEFKKGSRDLTQGAENNYQFGVIQKARATGQSISAEQAAAMPTPSIDTYASLVHQQAGIGLGYRVTIGRHMEIPLAVSGGWYRDDWSGSVEMLGQVSEFEGRSLGKFVSPSLGMFYVNSTSQFRIGVDSRAQILIKNEPDVIETEQDERDHAGVGIPSTHMLMMGIFL